LQHEYNRKKHFAGHNNLLQKKGYDKTTTFQTKNETCTYVAFNGFWRALSLPKNSM